jgi:hypothetical protein
MAVLVAVVIGALLVFVGPAGVPVAAAIAVAATRRPTESSFWITTFIALLGLHVGAYVFADARLLQVILSAVALMIVVTWYVVREHRRT